MLSGKLPNELQSELKVKQAKMREKIEINETLKKDFANWWLASLQVYYNAIMQKLHPESTLESTYQAILNSLKHAYPEAGAREFQEKIKQFHEVQHGILPMLYQSLAKEFGWNEEKQSLFELFSKSHEYRAVSLAIKDKMKKLNPVWAERYSNADKDLATTIFATASAIAIHQGKEENIDKLAEDLAIIANWMLGKIIKDLQPLTPILSKVVEDKSSNLNKLSDKRIFPYADGWATMYAGRRKSSIPEVKEEYTPPTNTPV